MEPLAHFKNAFNIWQYNIASNEHVITSDTQTADTALAIQVTSGGCIDDPPDITAAIVWHIAGSLGLVKPLYYPEGGNTRYINKNLVVVILVFDPEAGASGFSGISRRLANPTDNNQRISTAFSHNTTHEFLHAFARLADEYLADDSGQLGSTNAEAVLAAHHAACAVGAGGGNPGSRCRARYEDILNGFMLPLQRPGLPVLPA